MATHFHFTYTRVIFLDCSLTFQNVDFRGPVKFNKQLEVILEGKCEPAPVYVIFSANDFSVRMDVKYE